MSKKFFLPDQYYKAVNVHGPNIFNIVTTLDDDDTVRFNIDSNVNNRTIVYEIENATTGDFSISNTGTIALDSNGNATLVANLNIYNNAAEGDKTVRLKLKTKDGGPEVAYSANININLTAGPNITSNSNVYSTIELTDRIIHKWVGSNTDTATRQIYFTVNDVGYANNTIQILQVAPGGGAINQTGWSTNIATRQRAAGGAGAGEHANYTVEAWQFDSAYYDPGSYTNIYEFGLTPSGKGQSAANPDYTITPTSGTDLSIIRVGTTSGIYTRPFNTSSGTQDYVNYVRPGFTTYYNPKGGGHGGTYKDGVSVTSGKGGGAAGNGSRGTATPLGYLGGLGSLGGFDGTYYDIVGGGGGGSASGNGENANSTIPVEGDGAAPTTITFISNVSTTTQTICGGSDGVSYRQTSPTSNGDKPGGGGHRYGGPAALYINVPRSFRKLTL